MERLRELLEKGREWLIYALLGLMVLVDSASAVISRVSDLVLVLALLAVLKLKGKDDGKNE